MIDLDNLTLRDLQKESARALVVLEATNNSISKFNSRAHHNSQEWFKAVIRYYVENYGDLPSKAGPGKDVKILLE